MGEKGNPQGRSSRCIALAGPQGSGKTTLFEALLARTGATGQEGADIRKTIGDHSPEAQAHGMSVELNVANIEFLGDSFTLLDCPGSVEFQFEGMAALPACDAAVVAPLSPRTAVSAAGDIPNPRRISRRRSSPRARARRPETVPSVQPSCPAVSLLLLPSR